jgi:hypothetical protein
MPPRRGREVTSLLRRACNNREGSYTITAHECPRIKPEFLEEEKRSMGELMFRQEYLCEFVEAAGQLFRQEDIDRLFNGGAKALAIPRFGDRAAPSPSLATAGVKSLPFRFDARTKRRCRSPRLGGG